MTTPVQRLRGLGRVVNHDPRSWNYPIPCRSPQLGQARQNSVRWTHRAEALNQRDLGACTGFALAQWANCATNMDARQHWKDEVFYRRSTSYLSVHQAMTLYSRATELDPFPGNWPPTDTGSSGLAVCKAGVERGIVKSYRWAFDIDDVFEGIHTGPLLVGTIWTEDMYTLHTPDYHVHPTGKVLGGHEYLMVGYNARRQKFIFKNSWGPDWGNKGFFTIGVGDFMYMLDQQGDVVLPVF